MYRYLEVVDGLPSPTDAFVDRLGQGCNNPPGIGYRTIGAVVGAAAFEQGFQAPEAVADIFRIAATNGGKPMDAANRVAFEAGVVSAHAVMSELNGGVK